MPATVAITSDVDTGIIPLTVTFTATVTGDTAIGYLWDFGDGTTSTRNSPAHTYVTYGLMSVTVTAYLSAGGSVSTMSQFMIRAGSLDFDVYPTSGKVPLTVTLTNKSSAPTGFGYTGYSWGVGSGVTLETGPDCIYTYTTEGTKNVSLSAMMYPL